MKDNKDNKQDQNKLEDTKIESMSDQMQLEEPKEDINIDDVYKEKYGKKVNTVDLRDKKETKTKDKKTYDIDDTVIRDITLAGDIHVRLISNVNGYFIDIRKYIRDFPTKKGIRFLASKFMIAAEYLKGDLEKLVHNP